MKFTITKYNIYCKTKKQYKKILLTKQKQQKSQYHIGTQNDERTSIGQKNSNSQYIKNIYNIFNVENNTAYQTLMTIYHFCKKSYK